LSATSASEKQDQDFLQKETRGDKHWCESTLPTGWQVILLTCWQVTRPSNIPIRLLRSFDNSKPINKKGFSMESYSYYKHQSALYWSNGKLQTKADIGKNLKDLTTFKSGQLSRM